MCTLVWFLRSKLEKISFSSFPLWEMTLEAGLWSLKHACTDAGFRQRKGQCKRGCNESYKNLILKSLHL